MDCRNLAPILVFSIASNEFRLLIDFFYNNNLIMNQSPLEVRFKPTMPIKIQRIKIPCIKVIFS